MNIKLVLFVLLATFAISCGDEAGKGSPGWIDTNGKPDRPHGPGWLPLDGATPLDDPRIPIPDPRTPIPEGFVCDGRGICVPEGRVLKNPPPNVDRFGFRTDVVAVPYDPCKHDGICGKKGEGE